jgi:hypothetical protein
VLNAIRGAASDYLVAERLHELVVDAVQSIIAADDGQLVRLQRELDGVRSKIDHLTEALAEAPASKALHNALATQESARDSLEARFRRIEQQTAMLPDEVPTLDWVRDALRAGLPEPSDEDTPRWALVIRQITGPIRVEARMSPHRKSRYPVLCFTIDWCRALAAITSPKLDGVVLPVTGAVAQEFELDARVVPLYEKHAEAVVRMRDIEGLSWREITRRLSDRMSPDYSKAAYRFGKYGDPWRKESAA